MSGSSDTDEERAEAPADGQAPSERPVEPAAGAAPVRKKKKKKKRGAAPAKADDSAGEAEPLSDEPALDVTGAERAAFLGWFPSHPELDAVVRAFEVGNYALVRERARELAERAEDEKVRAAARELLARIEPDPLMKYLLLGVTLLLLFLVFFAYRSHAH